MPTSLNDILSWTQLTKMVQEIKPGIPKVLPEALWTLTEEVYGNKVANTITVGSRQVASAAPYLSKSKQVKKLDVSTQAMVLISSYEHVEFGEDFMDVLRRFESYDPQDNRFYDHLLLQTAALRKRFDNLRIATVTSLFANAGKIYFDSDNKLLPSSSGAALTVDMGVPSGNVGNPGSIVSGSWATASTNIFNQIANLKTFALQQSNYPIKYAIYGKNVGGYVYNNASMQLYLSRNPGMNQKFNDTGKIPDGFLDLTWIPAQDFYYVDDTGTVQEMFPADQVTFIPEIDRDVYTLYEGTTPVPTDLNIQATPEAALRSVKEVRGIGANAVVEMDPPKLLHKMFDCHLPRWKVPGSMITVDTTP